MDPVYIPKDRKYGFGDLDKLGWTGCLCRPRTEHDERIDSILRAGDPAYIARCVNAHADLLGACERALMAIDELRAALAKAKGE